VREVISSIEGDHFAGWIAKHAELQNHNVGELIQPPYMQLMQIRGQRLTAHGCRTMKLKTAHCSTLDSRCNHPAPIQLIPATAKRICVSTISHDIRVHGTHSAAGLRMMTLINGRAGQCPLHQWLSSSSSGSTALHCWWMLAFCKLY
jgi:hypothetical protein